jgi:hypothetical protein
MMLVEPAKVFKDSKTFWKDFKIKADFFDTHKSNLKLLKFVPASGAASRMFKFLCFLMSLIY